jgi:hypothetical protein
MEKLSNVQIGQMMKVASDGLRALSEELVSAKTKLAHFERKERAEKIATQMEEKSLNSDLSFEEKVAHLMGQENLDVIEQAVGMSNTNMNSFSLTDKVAHVGDGSSETDVLVDAFAESLASI